MSGIQSSPYPVIQLFTNYFFLYSFSNNQAGEDDTSQFDSKFTKQTPVDSPDDTMLSESMNQVFKVSSRVSRGLRQCLTRY